MESRKTVGFIAGAGLGAAAVVALRRRWAGGDDPDEAVPALPPGPAPGTAGGSFLANLRRAVAIPTVTHDDPVLVDLGRLAEFRDFLAATYPTAHERLEVELVAGHSLLFTWRGSDPAALPFLLMAHQDVVPVEPGTEGEWEAPPFAGDEDEHHLYGRGALDDKGSLIGILEAVEALLGEGFEPAATVHLAFGHDEEAGGSGAAAIASLLEERGVRCSFALDEGGAVAVDFLPGVTVPVALIGVGEKGAVGVRLTARGAGGHSSAPPARTTIGRLGAAIARLEDRPMPPRLGAQRRLFEVLGGLMPGPRAMALRRPDLFGAVIERRLAAQPATNALIRTTGATTTISGGIKPNVLCQEATAVIDFRVMPGDTVASVLDHVREVVGPDIEVAVDGDRGFTADPPAVADADSDAFRLVAELAREVCGAEAAAPWITPWATDARHFVAVAEQVLRFVPLTATAEDLGRFHGTGERIRRADADSIVAFYRELIVRAGSPA